MKTMKLISPLALAFFFAISITNLAHAAVPLATAINKAGQQRMLSQRIAKAYLLVAADVNMREANRQLDESIGLFEQNQQLLLEFQLR